MISVYSIVSLVRTLFSFYSFLVLIYCLLSWFPRTPGGLVDDIAAVLDSVVGPYLNLFRRFIPPMGGVDWSPVVAILVLNLLEKLILRVLL